MTPENKQELLKNCIVLKVQKQDDWARPVEDAVREELGKVLSSWLKATETEGIGPKEVVAYIDRLFTIMTQEVVVTPPAESVEQ